MLSVYDPGVELRFIDSTGRVPPDLVGTHHGHEGFRHVWQMWLGSIDDAKIEPEEVIDTGDRFLVSVRMTGHGSGGGVPIDERYFEVFTVWHGQVVRDEIFLDRDQAMGSLGLRK